VLDRVALVHENPERVALAKEIEARYPTDWATDAGMSSVIRDARPLFLPEIADELLVASARDAEHLRLLREIHFSSLIVVPLVARGVTLGALTLCHTESGRHYDAADLSLAEDLAQRAALAVDNARLYRDAESARLVAEDANRAKSQFLATMSHELRTPLNAIAGYVQLLALGLHGPVTDAQRDALERIDRAQRHLLGLINDVLNYARLEGGRVEYDLRSVLVADVVRDVWAMVEPQFTAKRLAFEVRLPEDAGRPPVPVWADREKLVQILLNLLSNAVKFTPAERDTSSGPVRGHVLVELSDRDGGDAGDAGATDDHSPYVYLRISDTGVGIPESKLARVFEPFVQVRSELTRETGGTGLGLAISRDLARGMGGDLRVRSTEGAGSTFTLVLRRVVSTTEKR
jgi:signal transduction histidine kinase